VTLVKICGITTEEDALMAAEAGARAVGLVFWPGSPRFVDRARARTISRALPRDVWRVGVFVDASHEELNACAEEVGLDVLQLHGDETPGALPQGTRRIWKALRVGGVFSAGEALRFQGRVDGILLDSKTDRPGGSGESFDWGLARPVRELAPFLILAGGLDPSNVGAAIRALRPDLVDVSPGVESSPGRKDRVKVEAFMEAVRKVGT
jgi:phosphoribosylanthranilate isomerase